MYNIIVFVGLLLALFTNTNYQTLSHSTQLCTNPHIVPAHAHNDYKNTTPLHNALNSGVSSIEVDVFLVKDELYVAHLRPLFPDKRKTLTELYLNPLQELVQQNGGCIYTNTNKQCEALYLMIDIKTDGVSTFNKLQQLMTQYPNLFAPIKGNEKLKAPVKLFISGKRPYNKIMEAKPIVAMLDGRPSDLAQQHSPQLMPVISDRYKNHLSWKGKGLPKPEEAKALQQLVQQIHQQGKKLRLWAAPDTPKVWRFLLNYGVDWINTDQPKKFSQWYNKEYISTKHDRNNYNDNK